MLNDFFSKVLIRRAVRTSVIPLSKLFIVVVLAKMSKLFFFSLSLSFYFLIVERQLQLSITKQAILDE